MIFKKKQGEYNQILLMILCWGVYTLAYTGRYSYNSNLNLVISDFGLTHVDAGLVTTFFFFAYGLGQFIHGALCKWYNQRFAIPAVLFVSAILNLAVFFGVDFKLYKYLWMINGISQAVLWPTIVLILSQNLDDKHMKTAIVLMSSTTAIGTLITYGASFLFIKVGEYKLSFLMGGLLIIIAAIIWFILFRKNTEITNRKSEEKIETKVNTRKIDIPFLIFIIVFCYFSIVDNYVKDGLNTWVPVFLKEQFGMTDGLSILLTLILPIFGIFGATFAVVLNKKIKDMTLLTTILYKLTAILMGIIVLIIDTDLWYIVLVVLGLSSFMAHAICNVVTSFVPIIYKDRINSGFFAGLLNGFCYVGGTIASYTMGSMADGKDWSFVFKVLLAVVLFTVLLGLVYYFIQKRRNNRKI